MTPAPPAGPRRRRPRANPTTEAHFDAHVVGLSRYYGFRSYHTADSRRSNPGYPDRTFVKGPRLIYAELKVKSAEEARKSFGARTTRAAVEARPEWLRFFDVTDAQAAWLEDLAGVGSSIAVMRAAWRARPNLGAEVISNVAGVVGDPSVEVYLWRPEDLERIVHVFAGADPDVNLDAGVAWARERLTITPGGPA